MARDGLIPSVFASVHPRFKTPWINTLLVGLLACGAAGFLSLDALSNLTNIGALVAFTMVCVTVIYLRISQPGLARPFRTPLYPLTPIIGGGMCVALTWPILADPEPRPFFSIEFTTAEFFGVYLGIGLLIYFLYGLWNSKVGKGEG
jgi:APA family basic amino acid/polyamine antiporter